MKRKTGFARALPPAAGLVLALLMTGCAGGPAWRTNVVPPPGFLFAHVRAPLTTEFEGERIGDSTKKVSQKMTKYFREPFFTNISVSWDKAAIAEIARDGGIETVSYADYEVMNILGIYTQFKINVYGN